MRYANFDTSKLLLFNKFINNIKAGDTKPLRNAILEQCNVSLTAYRKWVRGLAMPRPENQEIINDIAVKYGYGMVYLHNNEDGI